MNRDEIAGKSKEIKGSIKESTGRAIGNPNLEDRGAGERAAGKARQEFGTARRDLGNKLEELGEKIKK